MPEAALEQHACYACLVRHLLATLVLAGALAASCSSDSETERATGGSGNGATAGKGGTLGSGGSGGNGGSGATSGTGGNGGTGDDASTDSGSAGAAGSDGGAAGLGGSTDGGTFVGSCSSTLPGVCVRFPTQQTSFTVAEALAGITIRYEVAIEHDVQGVITLPQDAGRCGSPAPGGLYVLEEIAGSGQDYCVCDYGFCAPLPETPVTLRAGVYAATFSWDGVNWGGPSDTGNPKGAAFPPGNYNLTVSSIGRRELDGGLLGFVVTGVLGIELVL